MMVESATLPDPVSIPPVQSVPPYAPSSPAKLNVPTPFCAVAVRDEVREDTEGRFIPVSGFTNVTVVVVCVGVVPLIAVLFVDVNVETGRTVGFTATTVAETTKAVDAAGVGGAS